MHGGFGDLVGKNMLLKFASDLSKAPLPKVTVSLLRTPCSTKMSVPQTDQYQWRKGFGRPGKGHFTRKLNI